MTKRYQTCLALLVGGAVAFGSGSAIAYDYNTSPTTNISGAACMPTTTNSNEDVVFDQITRGSSGLTLTSNWTAGGIGFTCPITRRNATRYGKAFSAAKADRILVSSLRVRVRDGNVNDVVACVASVDTFTGSSYSSSWRNACSTTNGCTANPPNSFTGSSELVWTNPFGTTAISKEGAVGVSYLCILPSNSSINWAEASYSTND